MEKAGRDWVVAGRLTDHIREISIIARGNAGRRYRVPMLMSPKSITPAAKTAKARKRAALAGAAGGRRGSARAELGRDSRRAKQQHRDGKLA